MKKRNNEQEVKDFLKDKIGKRGTVTEIKQALSLTDPQVYDALKILRDKDIVLKDGTSWIFIGNDTYLDWNNNLKKMIKLYEMKVPTLLIGPKGTGKSECTQELSKKVGKKMYTVNLSLRCRETHLLGRLDIKEKNGVQEINWQKGPLPQSMENGSILYLDELSAGEPDVLLRLDEALDSRRQLNYEGQEIKAHDDWWCTSSINPLTTPGTKELPPQLISRFTARLYFDYPDERTELKIVQTHCEVDDRDTMFKVLRLFNTMRNTQELPYSPSLRESIVFAKMMNEGFTVEEGLEIVAFNALHHWDNNLHNVARELAQSVGLV